MEGLWGLQGVMREEYSRDLTNLDLGRGDEEWVRELGSSLFVCVTRTYMILFKMKGICDNVNYIYCHTENPPSAWRR